MSTGDNIEYLRNRINIDAILFATNDDAQHKQDQLIKYCTEKDSGRLDDRRSYRRQDYEAVDP